MAPRNDLRDAWIAKYTLPIHDRLSQWLDYVKHLDPSDAVQIDAIRAAGRAVGRKEGWKVMTHQSDPHRRKDGKVVVGVSRVDEPPADVQAQRDKQVRQALDNAFRQGRT